MTIPCNQPLFFYLVKETACRTVVEKLWRCFLAKGNSDLRSPMPLNRADAPTITGITKTLFYRWLRPRYPAMHGLIACPLFGHKVSAIDTHPYGPVRYQSPPVCVGGQNLKTCCIRQLFFVVLLPSRLSLDFLFLFTDASSSGFTRFCNSILRRTFSTQRNFSAMQKTHSQKHTCIFPIPTWLIKVFPALLISGSSNTQTQKNNGDCYDTTRGCCSRGSGDRKSGH